MIPIVHVSGFIEISIVIKKRLVLLLSLTYSLSYSLCLKKGEENVKMVKKRRL